MDLHRLKKDIVDQVGLCGIQFDGNGDFFLEEVYWKQDAKFKKERTTLLACVHLLKQRGEKKRIWT